MNNDNLLTPKQYAEQHQVSPQSVYARIKRGTLSTIIIDGVSYIAATEATTPIDKRNNDKKQSSNQSIKEIIKPYKQHIKQLKQRIKDLEKQIEKTESSKDKEYTRLENLFNMLISNRLMPTPDDAIDTEIIKKKKKKKKKK